MKPSESKYLNDVASIDSYEIGTSSVQPTQHLTQSQDVRMIKQKKHTKVRDHIKNTKTITQYSSDREGGYSSKNTGKLQAIKLKIQQSKKQLKTKRSDNKSNKKSKSKSTKNINNTQIYPHSQKSKLPMISRR